MLKNLWYMLLSHLVVFKHLLKRPVTLEYPERKLDVHREENHFKIQGDFSLGSI